MPHGHETHPDVHVGARVRRVLLVVAVGAALLIVAGVILLRPGGHQRPDLSVAGVSGQYVDGRVESVAPGCANASKVACNVVTIRVLGGPDAGTTTNIELTESPGRPRLHPGDEVVLAYNPNGPAGFRYYFEDLQRKPALFWLAVLFGVAVVVLGGMRGVAALGGLVASLVVLLVFALPAIIDGRSPIWVAVVAAAAIAYFALYMAHGFTTMTTVALLGTLASLALTAALAVGFVSLTRLTGFASEEAGLLSSAAGTVDLRGLLLAGVVIGALGALDDMTVTQASAVWELHHANPTLGRRQLYLAGFRIGRDHIASTVNTLVLAYAGASMPLLVLFVLSRQSVTSVANGELVATEIVRTLVGSIGLVASVPLTTWLASLTVVSSPRKRGVPDRQDHEPVARREQPVAGGDEPVVEN
jgi:uncharacterized membrane protein